MADTSVTGRPAAKAAVAVVCRAALVCPPRRPRPQQRQPPRTGHRRAGRRRLRHRSSQPPPHRAGLPVGQPFPPRSSARGSSARHPLLPRRHRFRAISTPATGPGPPSTPNSDGSTRLARAVAITPSTALPSASDNWSALATWPTTSSGTPSSPPDSPPASAHARSAPRSPAACGQAQPSPAIHRPGTHPEEERKERGPQPRSAVTA